MSYKTRSNNFSVTSGRDGNRSFRGDHDDRFYSAPNNRGRGGERGNNRGGRNRRGGFKNFNSQSSRYRNARFTDDEDQAMGEYTRGRGNPRDYYSRNSRRGGRRSGSRGRNTQQHIDPEQQWYKVLVPFGARLGQTELFKLIQEDTDVAIPFKNYHTLEQRALFHVQGTSIAETIRTLSRRISTPDGHKLALIVNESGPPKIMNITDEQKKQLTECMSARYEPSVQLLNLSSFHSDESLKRTGTFLPLNKFNVMEAVTKIIAEHIPEMTGVNLTDNKLGSLGSLSSLVKTAPGVTFLNLSNNFIRSIDELDRLKGWTNIVELVLDGNDLCNSFSNQTDYISAVRKKFPKVIKLDEKDLPPPISFDIDALSLPATQGSFFLNEDIKSLLVSFVKEYYTMFDSDNRRGLMAAYNENAQFSYFAVRNATIDKQGDLSNYFRESHNLKRLGNSDIGSVSKKVKVGLLSVVSALEDFPKTTHDFNSFKVDVMFATPQQLSFVLHGVFKETASRADKPVIRTFSRTFVTIPGGGGVSIINDMLTVSNAGVEQARNAFKEGAPTPSSSPASSSQTTSQPVLPTDHKQMIENFVIQSGMNPDFSMKCLQENSWDYQRAAQNFQELNSQGKIPPEAFVK